jgi:hypothetical protein
MRKPVAVADLLQHAGRSLPVEPVLPRLGRMLPPGSCRRRDPAARQ